MMFDDSQALSPEDEPEDMDATAESESSNGSTPLLLPLRPTMRVSRTHRPLPKPEKAEKTLTQSR